MSCPRRGWRYVVDRPPASPNGVEAVSPLLGTEGVRPVRIRLNKPNPDCRWRDEGTSASARECPHVTAVSESDN
jgi:hypothetical protein